jgi:hypothetical protein
MAAGTTSFSAQPGVQPGVGVLTETKPHHEAIREQLARILASPQFRSSKHYPALLRYVVEQALEGHSGQLKERTLGVAVFGRAPQSDTNQDPVVRTSAGEVRKRIAQYYHEPGRESEIRIDLPSGSYVPDFHPAAARPVTAPEVALTRRPAARVPFFYWCAAALSMAAVGIGAAALRPTRSAVDLFWAPVWAASDSVMISLGSASGSPGTPAVPAPEIRGAEPTVWETMRDDRLAYADAVTMARLTGLLRENHKRFDIRRGAALTLTDLRKGPAILIGGFNNVWTMRLENELRFEFEQDTSSDVHYIRDRQNPSQTAWKGDHCTPYSKFNRDYALISRFVDNRTERVTVIVAGIAKDGTLAAGEFVTEPRYLEAFAASAPRGWEHKNLQVVISTEVVNGNTGPPRILATHFW